jgi:hypothetical protein
VRDLAESLRLPTARGTNALRGGHPPAGEFAVPKFLAAHGE